MNAASHLFASDTGELFDTRRPEWWSHPLRQNFKKHHRTIDTTQDLKATLRAGPFAWPGGYPLGLICSDGGLLCFDCARKELRQILWSITKSVNDGWRVVACEIMHDEPEAQPYCDHCDKRFNEED